MGGSAGAGIGIGIATGNRQRCPQMLSSDDDGCVRASGRASELVTVGARRQDK